jgi:hypothetical protein
VIVVAHGAGGLVARYWLGPIGGHPWCEALLTLGTPHRGMPLALDWLINGARLGRVPDEAATTVVRGWPSMYELLPQYEAVWDTDAGVAVDLTEVPATCQARNSDLTTYAPAFVESAKRGRRTHEEIAAAWAAIPPDQRPNVIPFFGRGHGTPSAAYLGAGRLWLTTDDPHWRGCVGWRGDGVVPMQCAVPDELSGPNDRDRWRAVADRHAAIVGAPGIAQILRHYAGDAQSVDGGDLPDRPWIGLELDGVVPARQPIRISAEVLPNLLVASGAVATIAPLDGTSVEPLTQALVNVDADGAATWTGELPPCVPGLYRVTVEARGVPVFEGLSASEVVAVVDDG